MLKGFRPDGGKGCPCAQCLKDTAVPVWWMVLCAICGNKRCPHANDHRHACTNSNEPGQKGSSWEKRNDFERVVVHAPDGDSAWAQLPELGTKHPASSTRVVRRECYQIGDEPVWSCNIFYGDVLPAFIDSVETHLL